MNGRGHALTSVNIVPSSSFPTSAQHLTKTAARVTGGKNVAFQRRSGLVSTVACGESREAVGAFARRMPLQPLPADLLERNEKGIPPLAFVASGARDGHRRLRPLGPADAGLSHQRGRRVGARTPEHDRRAREFL